MPRVKLSALDGANYDVIVLGAGINGASSAQHLSAAGYSTLLVDKGDFASGSTSRSTRLLHCGLRYFETPRPLVDFTLAPSKLIIALRMAKASMEVRGELVKDSPQRLRPFTLLFPIVRGGPYRGWQLDLAARILGRLGPKDVPLNYRRASARQAASLPFIREMADPGALQSVGMFTEYLFDWPERICIDAVLDAERLGATVRNYTFATPLGRSDDGLWAVALTDADQEQTATVHAPVVLNMTGIWIDRVNKATGQNTRRMIFGTKGAHIVVKLPNTFSEYGIATINDLGEPHYCVPSQGGHHHIGPTETPYEGDIDDIRADQSDREFLIGQTREILPGLGIAEDDVVSTWAGVRPLGNDPAYPKGKRSAEVHDLAGEGLDGIYALTAGPIMTHRTVARKMTETVAKAVRPSRPAQPVDYAPRLSPEDTNSPPLLAGDPSIRLSDLADAVNVEHATSLRDILIARTGAVYKHRLSEADIRRAAEEVSAHLGWDSAEVDRQIAAFQEYLRRTFGFN